MTGASLATINVAANPVVIVLNSDGSKAYMTSAFGSSVSVIDTATNTVTATIGVGGGPDGITLSPDGSKAYVANNASHTVSVIDTATNTLSATIVVGTTPRSIAISQDGTKAYVTDSATNQVHIINTTNNTVTGSIAVGTQPIAIVMSKDGLKAFVANLVGASVSIIDTATDTVSHVVPGIASATGISISPDGSLIYVRSYGNDKLYTFDTSGNSITEYNAFPPGATYNTTPFISPNLITGTLSVSSVADMSAKGFSNSVNFAGGTLRATGNFTLTNPIYLHDAFNLTWNNASTFTTTAGGTVDTNGNNVTFSGVVSGVGGLTKSGTGTLTLSGTNTYTGATTINGGTLTLSGGNAISDNGAMIVNAGGTLNVASAETIGSLEGAGNVILGANLTTGGLNTDTMLSGVISGTGGLTKIGTGVFELDGANTYTGDTNINAGTLALYNGDAIVDTGVVNVNAGGTLHVYITETVGSVSGAGNIVLDAASLTTGGTNTDTVFSGIISGSGGGLIKSGTGTLTLSGTNTFVGNATINGGTLTLSGGSAISDNSGVVVNTGGTLNVASAETLKSIAGAGNIILNANLTVGSSSPNTFSGNISGVGELTKVGTGLLLLSGTNTYSGGTTVSAGTLRGTTSSLQGNITNNATVEFSQNTDGTYSSIISGTGALTKSGTGVVTLSGANTYSGGTTVSAGTLKGTASSLQSNITNNATLEFSQNTDGTYASVMSGTGALTKSGTGTLTLSGTNTYTGTTTISAGTLSVTGDSHTSAFTANSGGTLSGNGTLGNTTINNGGFLAPSATSTLNVTGNVVMNAGSTLNINAYANGTNSKVVATGTATINGGTVAVHSDSAGTWNTSTDYTILTAAGGVAGTFTSVTDDLTFLTPTLTYDANNVMLNLARDTSVTYTSKATNSYSAGVGETLDNLGTPNAQMQVLIDTLNGTNDAGAAQMLSQLTGAPLSSLAHLSPVQIRSFTMGLYSRMNGGTGSSGGIGLASLAFADNGNWADTFRYLADAGAIGPNGFQEPQKLGDAQMWIRAVGGRTMTNADVSRNISDTTTTTGGLQAGVDKRTGDWIVGGSFGYLRSNVDQSGMDGKVDSYQLGFYTSQDTADYRLSFDAIGGKYVNSTARTTPTGTASAAYDGMAVAAEIKAAYKYPLNDAWMMEPALGGWVQRYNQEAYSESGATGSSLSVDKATFTSQAITTELKFINKFGESKADKGTFETAIGYSRESGDINAPLVGRFSAAPTAGSFSIASAQRGRDVFSAMVGSDVTVAANTRLFALVNGNYRENERGYSAMAGIKIGF